MYANDSATITRAARVAADEGGTAVFAVNIDEFRTGLMLRYSSRKLVVRSSRRKRRYSRSVVARLSREKFPQEVVRQLRRSLKTLSRKSCSGLIREDAEGRARVRVACLSRALFAFSRTTLFSRLSHDANTEVELREGRRKEAGESRSIHGVAPEVNSLK